MRLKMPPMRRMRYRIGEHPRECTLIDASRGGFASSNPPGRLEPEVIHRLCVGLVDFDAQSLLPVCNARSLHEGFSDQTLGFSDRNASRPVGFPDESTNRI